MTGHSGPSSRLSLLSLPPLLVSILLFGCEGDGPGAVASATVDTVAGVEALTYPAVAGPQLAWAVDTVLILGDAMAEPEYQFGMPGDAQLAGDGRGHIYVADEEGSRVLEYGPDGRHVATYGREGEGPGELKRPLGVAVGSGDTVWVNDPVNRRLTGYPRGGGEPRVVSYPRRDIFPGAQMARGDHGFLLVIRAITVPGEPIPEPLIRTDGALEPLDTLWRPPPSPVDIVQLDMGTRAFTLGLTREFWPEFRWRALPGPAGAAVVSDSADYVIRIIAGDGTVRRVVRREPPARAASEADRQRERDRILDGELGFSVAMDGHGPDEQARRRMAEARVDAMTFDDRIPRIVALNVDPHGRIWVGVSEDIAKTVQRIDVYEPDGSLVGELRDVSFPQAFTGEDRILTTRRDELDVPQVVVMRLGGMSLNP
ncbi:MAG TPA: hypothetical protein VMM83_03075 [Longimicrobiales bacterium]|nr:hypothetical protein [Longimicrobiales bacterium]